MKILVFYDNFVRDFRSSFLLKAILEKYGHICIVRPLWKDGIYEIKRFQPDCVVMGQVSEYSTSRIGLFCHNHSINLCLSTTEVVEVNDKLLNFFLFNQIEFNDSKIDLQILPGDILEGVIRKEKKIIHKEKYKLMGMPRMDFNIVPELRDVEVNDIRECYRIKSRGKVYLFVSDFIYDGSAAQVDLEDRKYVDVQKKFDDEMQMKRTLVPILQRFLLHIAKHEPDSVFLVKKHPWDKSNFLESIFGNNGNVVIIKDEYVTPLLVVSDYVFHTESTVAIEAWMQNKKTVAIRPDFLGDFEKLKYHMKHEVVVGNFEELLAVINSYPVVNSRATFLENFNYLMDGRASLRFVQSIDKLSVKENKNIPANDFLDILRHGKFLLHVYMSLFGYGNSYLQLLQRHEKEKKSVEKRYRMPVTAYVDVLTKEQDI